MPELQSGARQGRLRSKKLEDIPAPSQVRAEIPVLPATNRRRGVTGRGRASKAAAVAKVARAAPACRTVGGRGRGIQLIDLDPPDQPREMLPRAALGGVVQPVPGVAQDFILNQEAERIPAKLADLAMNGGSAEKAIGVEDEATTTPVPEQVCLFIFC